MLVGRRWRRIPGLSSCESCLAADGVTFFLPFSGEAILAGEEVFRLRLPPVSTASPELNKHSPLHSCFTLIPFIFHKHNKNKQKRREMTLGVFAYSFIWICRPRGPTFVEKTICVLVSPKRCNSLMNSSSSIVLEK